MAPKDHRESRPGLPPKTDALPLRLRQPDSSSPPVPPPRINTLPLRLRQPDTSSPPALSPAPGALVRPLHQAGPPSPLDPPPRLEALLQSLRQPDSCTEGNSVERTEKEPTGISSKNTRLDTGTERQPFPNRHERPATRSLFEADIDLSVTIFRQVREKASRLATERGLAYSPDQHIADMWGGVRRLVEIRLGLDDGSFDVTDEEKVCREVLAARNRAMNGLQDMEETIGSWTPEHFARIRMYKRW